MIRASRFLLCLAGLAGFLVLSFAAPSAARAVQLTLNVVDDNGADLPARLQIKDALGHYFPPDTDAVLMSHNDYPWMRLYFYHQGPLSMSLPAGVTTIMASHGMETRPVRIFPNVVRDTTIVVTLHRVYDLRTLGWYGGETHTHMVHPPLDYTLTPSNMHFIAQAEDLPMTWVLDNAYQFTGGPASVSTTDATLYFTVEYRSQAYGHAPLLGLKQIFGTGCCQPPNQAYPMLSDVRESWHPAWDEVMVMAHPCDGAQFFSDQGGWPDGGLAREIPVMVSSGNLEVYDITSYSNSGDLALSDWYRLLNCGYHVAAGSGTDAIMNRYWTRPAGGYRVYVKETGPTPDPAYWVQAEKAGRTFVTNFPLIPEFTVEGADAGTTLDRVGPSTVVSVHFVVESLLPVMTAKIIRNGEVAASFSVPTGLNGSYGVFNTQLTLNESSWIALRVDGTTDVQACVNSALFAHTSPVYIRLDGAEAERTADAGYFQDWCDSLQIFAENRGNWTSESIHDLVLQRIQSARTLFGLHFKIPPANFALLTPADGDTANSVVPTLFDWSDAIDTEAGDRIWYRLTIAPDSTFSSGYSSPLLTVSQLQLVVPLPANHTYWWRVSAQDRGGNTSICVPSRRSFYLLDYSSGVDSGPGGGRPGAIAATAPSRLSVWPNPSTSRVTFQWNQPTAELGYFEVFDTGGRLVLRTPATPGTAAASTPGGCPTRCPTGTWNGLDSQGRTAPSGLYWIRYVSPVPAVISGPQGAGMRTRFLLLR